VDGCLSSIFFSNRYSSYSFCPILTKVGTRDVCANTKKNYGTDFRNFAFKIFANLKKITVSSGAV